MALLLVARDLSRSYVAGFGRCWARVHVLSSVSLTLRAGERVLVVGGAGSGKTTLLHCLTGLRRPDAGSVRWDASHGVPYRLCREPADVAAVGPRGAALVELPGDARLAAAWSEALSAHPGRGMAWLVLARGAAPLAPFADRVLELHEGSLRPAASTRPQRVAEPARARVG